jgi:hypothetical protein
MKVTHVILPKGSTGDVWIGKRHFKDCCPACLDRITSIVAGHQVLPGVYAYNVPGYESVELSSPFRKMKAR